MAKTRCAICNVEFDIELAEFLPFCSKRCVQIDLSRWLGEEYGFPIDNGSEEEFNGYVEEE